MKEITTASLAANAMRDVDALATALRCFAQNEAGAKTALSLPEFDDAPRFIALASRHGLLPLLRRMQEDGTLSNASRELRAACWVAYESNRNHNDQAQAQLKELLALLESSGIQCLAHKGPALSQWLYSDPALRVYTDLDLLVKASDVFAACDALEAAGYLPYSKIAPQQRGRFLEAGLQYDMKLTHPERPMLVELHWRTDALYYTEDLTSDALRANALVTTVAGHVVRQLPKRDLMFALLVHGTKHQWSRLAWLLDIALLAQRLDDTDWTWLASQASALKCQTRVLIGLKLATPLLPFPALPSFEWNATNLLRATKIADKIEQRLCDAAEMPEPGWFAQFLDDLRCNDTCMQSIRQIARLVFTPNLRDWDRVGGHPFALCTAFPQRILGALTRQSKRLIRRT